MTVEVQPETNELLEAANRRLRSLSIHRLRVANDFLAYLEEREENEATEELLNIPRFEREFEEAIQQVENGELVSFKSIRQDE